jgi:hypothetical protein
MKSKLSVALIFVLVSSLLALGDGEVKLPKKKNFHLFLLAGQSNMAGRGTVEEQDLVVHPRVFALDKEGNWKPAVAPMHFDKSVAGVGLGKSFAVALAERDDSVFIGLIPVAHGGSPIESWEVGGYHEQTNGHPYDDAVKRARKAKKDGVLKGILWHQGESDSRPERAKAYKLKLDDLIKRFRKDLRVRKVPFAIGQLGQFPEKPWDESRTLVDTAHRQVAHESPLVEFVSSDGLICKSDNTHFTSQSLREFGRRFAEAYLKIAK